MAMTQLSVIRLAHLRRREQRGMAVFMVVMVLTLVSAIGVFSMRSASLVDVATGYNRQSVQAGFMAEYAARASATYLGENAGLVDSRERITGCATALQNADPDAPCNVLKTSLLAERYTATAPQAFSDGLSGRLSTPGDATSIQAEFVTELTEPGPASVMAAPGFVAGQFKQITLTAIARVFPIDASSTDVCDKGARGSLSQQMVRAHVTVPFY
jgi:Tfp pilus assembly protein PilX